MTAPATAVLASSLLQISPHAQRNADDASERPERSPTWDLMGDIDTGVPLFSDRNVFSCGRVVGISALRPPPIGHDQSNDDGDDMQTWVCEVSLHVLVNTLAGIPPSSSSYPRVLLVQFLDNRPVTRGSLFHSLQQRLPGHPSEKIDAMISKVQIYRAFEFNEILETVTRISDTLHNIQQQQKQAATRAEGSDHRASRVSSDEEIEPTLVILEGIDRSLEEVVRSSNPLAGQAKLTTLLRTLTILSRTYAPFVTIIVVNTISLPAVLNGPEPQGRGYEAQSAQTLARISPADTSAQNNVDAEQRRYRTQPNQRYHQQQTHPSIPIQPIFAQAPASLPLSVPRPIAPYPSLLARTLDQGFDTHLLISRVQGRIVIEVAKDRVGDHLGRWCAL